MLSNTSKYAVRALIYLALNGTSNSKIGIKQISNDLDIPMPFLGKIMQTLAKQKVLSSSKGPHGGFTLNRKAHEIFLMDIIEIIDGIDSFNMCILGLGDCNNESTHCPIHQDYAEFRETLKILFQKESLGVLADRIRESSVKLTL